MTDEDDLPIDRRQFMTTTGAVGAGAFLAGCSGDGARTTGGASGGTFVDTSARTANTLDPRTNELAWVGTVISYLFDGLLIRKPDGSGMVPHLAKELPTFKDDTTATVPLKEGVSFHNGTELTAEDVAYTYNWILDPDNGSVRRQNIAFMDSVEAVDEYTVQFNLETPFALFEQALGEAILPKSHVEGMDPETFGTEPIGTGPFQFDEWQEGDRISLTRFDDYFLQKPKLEGFEARIIPEKQVQFVELSTGNVSQASIPNTLLNKAQNTGDITLKRIATFDYNGLIFNALREPFDDVRVREAMQYLVEYDELVEAAKGTLGNRTYGFMPKTVNEAWAFPWQEWEEKFLPEKDHDQAKQLLGDAGYGDGFGRTLTITTMSQEKFRSLALILQRELNEIGVDVEINEVSTGKWVDSLNKDSYDINVYGWTGGQDPDGFYYYLFRDLTEDEGSPEASFEGNSSAGMLHQAAPDDEELARVDEIARKARQLQDRAERKSLYTEAAAIMHSKYPHIPAFSELSATAYRKEIEDYELTSFAQQPLCNQWHNAYME